MPLSHHIFGDGAPLILMHGLFGTGRNWASVAKKLGTTHKIFALDLPDHGRSQWMENTTVLGMKDAVLAFMDAHCPDGAIVMGHSLGGKVGMCLALEHPERVHRLAVIDIAPVRYPPRLMPYVHAMRAARLTGVSRRAEVEAEIRSAIPDDAIRAFLMQNLVSSQSALSWRLNLAGIEDGMADICDFPDYPAGTRYGGPTLFLSGGNSEYTGPQHHEAILTLFPNTRFANIDGAGHWVHAEKPREFVELVSAFLAE